MAWTVYTPLPSRRRTNEFCRTSASRAARVSGAAAEIRLRQGELLKRTEREKHVPHVRGEWQIKLFFQKGGHIRWQFVLGILRGR